MFDPPVSEQNIDPVPRSIRSNKDSVYHHEHHHTHDHVHDPGVSSVSIVCERNLDLEKGNTSFKEKLEIMLSSAILKLSTVGLSFRSLCFSAFYGNEKKGENVGLNCNFQFFTLLVVKIKGRSINIIFGVFQASNSQTG
ncbi:unnamed protein product [Malus baccata var. baccata]